MKIQLNGYQTCVVMQALEDADRQWGARIINAQSGNGPDNFSIEGAKLLREDLRDVMKQMRRYG